MSAVCKNCQQPINEVGDGHAPPCAFRVPEAPRERMDTCASCRFFQRPTKSPFAPDFGDCRRRSPMTNPLVTYAQSIWPHVDGGDWCGEYQPRRA